MPRVCLANVVLAPGLGLVLGVVAPGPEESGIRVRVRCAKPGPWGWPCTPLLGVKVPKVR